jgi:hypothetical protein
MHIEDTAERQSQKLSQKDSKKRQASARRSWTGQAAPHEVLGKQM